MPRVSLAFKSFHLGRWNRDEDLRLDGAYLSTSSVALLGKTSIFKKLVCLWVLACPPTFLPYFLSGFLSEISLLKHPAVLYITVKLISKRFPQLPFRWFSRSTPACVGSACGLLLSCLSLQDGTHWKPLPPGSVLR